MGAMGCHGNQSSDPDLAQNIIEFIFVFKCYLCWLQVGCTGWIINLGFFIARRVWVSDILFLVFHEKVT